MVLRSRERGRVGRRRHLYETPLIAFAVRGVSRPSYASLFLALEDGMPRPAVHIGSLAVASTAILLAEHRVRRKAERLAAALLETLLFAIDANDPETGKHVRRVATYSLILADAAELDEHKQRTVERVALFHDIGKIHHALFDLIHDPGTLDPAERRAIATHPLRGAQVLAPLDAFYPDLSEGVISHHERWDGAGYPRRLKGSRIPLSARIVTIADTFDVITHGRSYASKRTLHRALQIVSEERGAQFDPDLADLFIQQPVLERVSNAMRRMKSLGGKPRATRRHKHSEHFAPDITFRWRSEVPGQQRQGRVRRGANE